MQGWVEEYNITLAYTYCFKNKKDFKLFMNNYQLDRCVYTGQMIGVRPLCLELVEHWVECSVIPAIGNVPSSLPCSFASQTAG